MQTLRVIKVQSISQLMKKKSTEIITQKSAIGNVRVTKCTSTLEFDRGVF